MAANSSSASSTSSAFSALFSLFFLFSAFLVSHNAAQFLPPAIYSISQQNLTADSAATITITGWYAGPAADFNQVQISMQPPNEALYSPTISCSRVGVQAFKCNFALPARGTGKVPFGFTMKPSLIDFAPLPRWGADDVVFTDAPVLSQDKRLCTPFWNDAAGAAALGWAATPGASSDLLCSNDGLSPLGIAVVKSASPPLDSSFDLPQNCISMTGAGSIWAQFYLCIPMEVHLQYTFALLTGSQQPTLSQVCVPLIKSTDSGWQGKVQLCSIGGKPYDSGTAPYYQYKPPTLSGFAPNRGDCDGGLRITFTGTSFGMNANSIAVQIGKGSCTSISPISLTQFSCLTPAGEGPVAGKNPVTVTIGGQKSIELFDFVYNPPLVYGWSLVSGTLSTAGGSTISITGRNFGTTKGTVTLTHPSIQSQCIISTQTNTGLVCQLPSGVGTNIPLYFSTNYNLGTFASNSTLFSYAPPKINSLSPPTLTTSGDFLTINGDSFGPGGSFTGTILIAYNPVLVYGQAPPGPVPCKNPSWSHTQIVCASQAGSGSSLFVSVTVQSQTSNTAPIGFTPPVITRFGPTQANSIYSPPPEMTIYGTNFGPPDPNRNFVRIGGFPCLSVQVYTSTYIVCTPPGPAITGQGPYISMTISAWNQNATWDPAWVWPREFGWTPSCDWQWGGLPKPTTGGLTFTGTNCRHFGKIAYNGTNAPSNWDMILGTDSASWSFSSRYPGGSGNGFSKAPITAFDAVAGTMSFILPEGAGVYKTVTIYTNGVIPPQYMQIPRREYWYDLPKIDSIFPLNGSSVGGYNLTIIGSNFGPPGSSAVDISSLSCPVIVNTHFLIICLVPLGSGANNTIFVRTGGQQSLDAILFSFNPPTVNTIAGIFPANGPTAGGYIVTIFGTGFTAGTLQVTFGPTLIVTNWLPSTGYTQAIVVCPPGRSKVNVIITVTKQSSNVIIFNYDPPLIQGMTPNSTDSAGGGKITVLGISFGSAAVSATLGGSACVAGVGDTVNNTMFVCTAPQGFGINDIVLQSENGISNPFPFAYSNPNVTGLSVPNGPTAGGPLITIFGVSFGARSDGSAVGQVFFNTSFPCVHNVVGASWTHNKIVCGLPAGEGVNLPIIVIAAGLTNIGPALAGQQPRFSYDPPKILATEASAMPTNGGSVITVRGLNFGFRGQVYVNGTICPYFRAPDHTLIQCILPAGQGPNVPIVVQVTILTPFKILISPNNSDLSYDPPVLTADSMTSVSRINGPTTGNTLITIKGFNFADTGFQQISVGQFIVNPSTIFLVAGSNKTRLTFRSPAGIGRDLPVKVTSATLLSIGESPLFNFDAPNITQITGCVDEFLRTTRCPITGGVTLTVYGSNFGTMILNQTSVFIRNTGNFNDSTEVLACRIVDYTDSQLRFILPVNPWGGYELPVVITTAGQSGEANLLSYLGPTFKAGSIRYWNSLNTTVSINTSTTGTPINLQLNSTLGYSTTAFNRRIMIQGTFFGNDTSNILVQYGLNSRDVNATEGSPKAFANKVWPCLVDAVFQTGLATGDSYLICRLSTGVGLNLALQIRVGIQMSLDSPDRISYPRPILIPNTLRYDNISAPGRQRLTGSSSQGDIIFFQADHLGPMPSTKYITAVISVNGTGAHACTELTAFLFNGVPTITCNTRAGFGDGWTFRLFHFGLPSMGSLPILPGDDIYDYVKNPEIRKVWGCLESGNATVNCDTRGGIALTMNVDFLGSKLLTIRIGSKLCANPVQLNETYVRCVLPPGAGLNVNIMVISGSQYSRPTPLLSYKVAQLLSVTGCTNNAGGTIDCDRYGGNIITITGNNFGPSAATVVVAGNLCKNVTQVEPTEHEMLTCILDQGTGLNQPVLLIQREGTVSRAMQSVSYLQCKAGFFSVVDVLPCFACPPGTFSDTDGLYACKPCASGRYTSVNISKICTNCLEGTFSRRNDTLIGPTQCSVCPVGSAINAKGADACPTCIAGFYQPGNSPTACLACPAGKFSGSNGAGNCTDCPLGRFTGLSGQQACASCDRGTYAGSLGLTLCADCSAGTISDIGQSNCSSCTPGRYNPSAKQSTCLVCDVGTYSSSGTGFGSTNCTSCQAGKSTNNLIGVSACFNCDVGFNASFTGLAACAACAQGYYANTTGLLNCLPCPPQYYQGGTGASNCAPCDTGRYSFAVATVQCLNCVPGSFAGSTGSAQCQPCNTGTFQPLSGKSFCFQCPGGQSQVQTGQVECADCVPGFYQNVTGSSDCVRCAPGSYSQFLSNPVSPVAYENSTMKQNSLRVPAVRGNALCSDCAPGFALEATGGTSCAACDYGKYAGVSGQVQCSSCVPGTAAGSIGATLCSDCIAGRFSIAAGASQCGTCDVGKFANNPSAATDCTACPKGAYQDQPEMTFCTNCTSGQFAPVTGTITCSICPPGTFSPIDGSASCTNCQPGSFASQPQSPSCTAASVGFYVPSSSASAQLDCNPGTYSNVTGNSRCSGCDIGSFQSDSGQSNCFLCQTGKSTQQVASPSCVDCARGKFAPVLGMRECVDAPLGQYQSEVGQNSSIYCAIGTAQQNTGQANCYICQFGTFSQYLGSGQCEPCSQGKYSGENPKGVTTCSDCDLGSSQISVGQPKCIVCALGKFANQTGLKECSDCAVGKYQSLTNQTQCNFCDVGTFASVQGKVECDQCAAGTYTPFKNSQSCIQCTSGQFQLNVGQTKCDICLAGRFAGSPGSVECTDCARGKFSSNDSAISCDDCASGRYQSDGGKTFCNPCLQGEEAPSPQSTYCTPCVPGTFSNSLAASNCTKCAPGRYNTGYGSSECFDCTPGKFASAFGSTTCKTCKEAGSRFVAKNSGQDRCDLCLSDASANELQTECICDAGYAMKLRDRTNPKSEYCQGCPTGAVCSDKGLKWDELETARGYWDAGNKKYYICQLLQQCPGGYPGSVPVINQFPNENILDARRALFDSTIRLPNRTYTCGNRVTSCGPNRPGETCCPADCKKFSNGTREVNRQGQTVNIEFCRSWAEAVTSGCPPVNGTVPRDSSKCCLYGWELNNNQECLPWLVESTICPNNRGGPLCSMCLPGYIDSFGGICIPCPQSQGQSTDTAIALVILIIFAVIAAVICTYWMILYIDRHVIAQAIEEENHRRHTEAGYLEQFEVDFELDQQRYERIFDPRGPPPVKTNHTFKVKILISFAQIVSNLAVSIQVGWPNTFKEVISWLTPFNFDFIQVSSAGCIVDTQYYNKLILVAIGPIVIVALIFIFYFFPQISRYRLKKDFDQIVMRKMIRKKTWKLVLFTIFFIYPFVSSTILSIFNCQNIIGFDYLRADYRLHCFDAKWTLYASFSPIFIIMYPIGIPAAILALLYRYRKRLDELGVRAQFGFIYEAYDREVWWFECLDMIHKLWLVSMVAFFPLLYQMPIAMFVSACFTGFLLIRRPYIRPTDDRLHLLSQCEVFILLLAGNTFLHEGNQDSWTDIVLSIVLIGVVFGFFGYFFFQAFGALFVSIKNWAEKKKHYDDEDMVKERDRDAALKSSKLSPMERRQMKLRKIRDNIERRRLQRLKLDDYSDMLPEIDRAELRRNYREMDEKSSTGSPAAAVNMMRNPFFSSEGTKGLYDEIDDENLTGMAHNPLNPAAAIAAQQQRDLKKIQGTLKNTFKKQLLNKLKDQDDDDDNGARGGIVEEIELGAIDPQIVGSVEPMYQTIHDEPGMDDTLGHDAGYSAAAGGMQSMRVFDEPNSPVSPHHDGDGVEMGSLMNPIDTMTSGDEDIPMVKSNKKKPKKKIMDDDGEGETND